MVINLDNDEKFVYMICKHTNTQHLVQTTVQRNNTGRSNLRSSSPYPHWLEGSHPCSLIYNTLQLRRNHTVTVISCLSRGHNSQLPRLRLQLRIIETETSFFLGPSDNNVQLAGGSSIVNSAVIATHRLRDISTVTVD